MSRSVVVISLIAVIYVGCARPVPPRPVPSPTPPPAVEPGPEPAPVPAPEPEPAPVPAPEAVSAVVDDEVVALAAGRDGVAVLGRRSVALIAPDGSRLAALDLAGAVPAGKDLPRRPLGAIVEAEEGTWDLWSSLLDDRAVYRFDPAVPSLQPVDVAPPPGAVEALERGWPGPVVEAGELVFRLDDDGLLHVEPDGAVSGGPVGEPLSASRVRGGWSVLVSAPVPPGEPDRVLELLWDGTELRPGRSSRPFDGRVAALAPGDGDVVVAVEEGPRRSRVIFLSPRALWVP